MHSFVPRYVPKNARVSQPAVLSLKDDEYHSNCYISSILVLGSGMSRFPNSLGYSGRANAGGGGAVGESYGAAKIVEIFPAFQAILAFSVCSALKRGESDVRTLWAYSESEENLWCFSQSTTIFFEEGYV